MRFKPLYDAYAVFDGETVSTRVGGWARPHEIYPGGRCGPQVQAPSRNIHKLMRNTLESLYKRCQPFFRVEQNVDLYSIARCVMLCAGVNRVLARRLKTHAPSEEPRRRTNLNW